MKIRYIQNTDSDITQVYRLLSQVWNVGSIENFTKNLRNSMSENIWFVMEHNNRILATAMLVLQNKVIRNGCTAGFIEEVVVDEQDRGNGIGEKLIKYITKYAFTDVKCYKVVLSCFPEREEFYKAMSGGQQSINDFIEANSGFIAGFTDMGELVQVMQEVAKNTNRSVEEIANMTRE